MIEGDGVTEGDPRDIVGVVVGVLKRLGDRVNGGNVGGVDFNGGKPAGNVNGVRVGPGVAEAEAAADEKVDVPPCPGTAVVENKGVFGRDTGVGGVSSFLVCSLPWSTDTEALDTTAGVGGTEPNSDRGVVEGSIFATTGALASGELRVGRLTALTRGGRLNGEPTGGDGFDTGAGVVA